VTEPIASLIARCQGGDRGALARLISQIEVGGATARGVSAATYPMRTDAWTVGITGAPGAGKSTLTDRLVSELVSDNTAIGVLAIDPSSPFSGGAILGDRIRMQSHATDPRVFIRSMATRGHLGGLAAATPQAARLLSVAGFSTVLIETVGVGQVEVEIAGHADTTVVVVNPGWGDAVQANKAGLMEIADIFVVNKADRDGARDTVNEIESMLMMAVERDWVPPIVATVASTGSGVDLLANAMSAHRSHVAQSGLGESRRRDRLVDEVRSLVVETVTDRALARCEGPEFVGLIDSLMSGLMDPYLAAEILTT
jgi:LAO/AO transport system kinase